MAKTHLIYYAANDGSAPVLGWLRKLQHQSEKAHAMCLARIEELSELGNELRRPYADYLDSGLYELRFHVGRKQYRIVYFFAGKGKAVLVHALTKERAIPPEDMKRALRRKKEFEKDPTARTYGI